MRIHRLPFFWFLITALAALAGAQTPPSRSPQIQFEDITRQAGLTASHISSQEQHYIIESMSGGVGMFDCDNDGKLDLLMVNGSTVDRYRKGGDPLVTLWHQEPGLKFRDITKEAGLTAKGWGMGVAVGDYDNDGILDIYVTGYGRSVLYHGLGNCKFEDVTDKAGVATTGFATGASWGDYDKDGKLDLFVDRYVHLDMDHLPEFGSNDKFCRFKGVLVQCGPWGMEGDSDYLFHNKGDGTFEEVSKQAGVSDPRHRFGLGAIWADYDNDGWPDLFVANDAGPNFLYHNKHDGTFEEIGLLTGVALGDDGQELGSMGVDFADYDHDGYLDLFVTNFTDETDNLYHNNKERGFTDMAWAAKLGQPSYPLVKWGTGFVDFDNDGWPDIFVASGHVYPQVDAIPGSVGYREPVQAFRNLHDGTFEDISESSGLSKMALASHRGVAFGDINNDGNVDVFVLNVGQPPMLLLNRTHNANHRVLFQLIGTKSNKAGIGARVTVRSGSLTQFNEVRGGASYLSQNDLRLHFGLGSSAVMDSVEVEWPSGIKDHFKNLPADFIYVVEEGAGIRNRIALPKVMVAIGGSRRNPKALVKGSEEKATSPPGIR